MAKPPSPEGRVVACSNVAGGPVREFAAADIRFRPAGYGLLFEGDRCLLSLSAFTGKWDLPGGGIEPWETVEEGLVREYREETGLEVEVVRFCQFRDDFIAFFQRPFHSLRLFYEVRAANSRDLVPDRDELLDLRWWKVDELTDQLMHPADRRLVMDVHASRV